MHHFIYRLYLPQSCRFDRTSCSFVVHSKVLFIPFLRPDASVGPTIRIQRSGLVGSGRIGSKLHSCIEHTRKEK